MFICLLFVYSFLVYVMFMLLLFTTELNGFLFFVFFFVFKQKTAYEVLISDWISDVFSSDLKLGVDAALDVAAGLLDGKRVIGIGSPRASLESNHALRELVGAEHFYSGIAAAELENIRLIRQLMQNGPLPVPSMRSEERHVG